MVSDGRESGWTRLPAPRSPCCPLCASLQGSWAGLGPSLSHCGLMAWFHLGLCNFFLLLCTAVPQFPCLKTVQASSLGCSWAPALAEQVWHIPEALVDALFFQSLPEKKCRSLTGFAS